MRRLPVLVAALTLGSAVFAHETWLLPVSYRLKPGEVVRIDLTSGMAFPKLESPIKPERIAKAALRLGGDVTPLMVGASGETSLALSRAAGKAGAATVWVDLAPKEIELTQDEVNEYFDEIAANADTREIWREMRGTHSWHETYTKHAKTFVAIGDASPDGSWREPVGSALEFVPKSSPFEARAGGRYTVRLLFDGKPLAWQPIGLYVAGKEQHEAATTGETGEATITLPAAGRTMLSTVRLVLTADRTRWVSDFATLTIDVLP